MGGWECPTGCGGTSKRLLLGSYIQQIFIEPLSCAGTEGKGRGVGSAARRLNLSNKQRRIRETWSKAPAWSQGDQGSNLGSSTYWLLTEGK